MPTPAELQAALDDLQAKVTADDAVDSSAITLLAGLNQMLKDALAAGTPQEAIDAVTALSARIDAQTQAMAAAVAANTPTP